MSNFQHPWETHSEEDTNGDGEEDTKRTTTIIVLRHAARANPSPISLPFHRDAAKLRTHGASALRCMPIAVFISFSRHNRLNGPSGTGIHVNRWQV